MPGFRTQPPLKIAAAAIVVLGHAASLTVFARMDGAVVQAEAGGAPVINLTLEPAPRFDGRPAPASDAAAPAAMPQPAATVLRFRQPASVTTPIEVLQIRPPSDNKASAPPQPAPLIRTTVVGQTGANRLQGQPSQAGDVTSGGGAATAGDAARNQEDAYAAAIIAWVERHKGRPRDRLTGVVTVRFELDRQGRMRRAEIVQQAPDSRVGSRALDALRTAQPFPRPPAGTSWTRREFTVRLDYRPAA